jgi:glycosyltransferase involved in cell wall biosynthesis
MTSPVSVFFVYNTTTLPYGGANSFNRTLRTFFDSNPQCEIHPVDDAKLADVIFLNAASRGPQTQRIFSFRKFRFINAIRDSLVTDTELIKFRSHRNAPIVQRLDGLTAAYGRSNGSEYDQRQIALNEMASFTIFQSRFCEDLFKPHIKDKPSTIIANGTDGNVFKWVPRHSSKTRWRILSAGWSTNPGKGHHELAVFSEHPDVEISYVGRWPERVAKGRVNVRPATTQAELASIMGEFHLFCHFAIGDPAPNVVIEALATGMPVLYRSSGGSPELAEGTTYGQPVNNMTLDDMSAALENITSRYDSLLSTIHNNRNKFLIETSAVEYANVFQKMRNSSQ